MPLWLSKNWPAAALLISAAMLATAHAFQQLGYQPCALCLRQREIYWVAIAAAGAAIVATRFYPRIAPVAAIMLGLIFLTGAGVAGYHAGVEWKFWPGPTTCSTAGISALNAKDMLDALDKPMHPPSCEDAAWRMAGISMAGYNAVISLALAALSLIAAVPPREMSEHD
jgi:disulfide bond formation protein DsbB